MYEYATELQQWFVTWGFLEFKGISTEKRRSKLAQQSSNFFSTQLKEVILAQSWQKHFMKLHTAVASNYQLKS